jgi:site-specific DNA-methyltransferase (adenine-specific)
VEALRVLATSARSANGFYVRPLNRNGRIHPAFGTILGTLYKSDCLKALPYLASASIDTVFADPPFNIGKEYGAKVNDRMADHEYLQWCEQWIDECIRVLKPGGSFFLYNIPKWNIRLANLMLDRGMYFRDWIVVDIKLGLPIPGRLYPSHYSLLYFTKGKPKTFHNIRTPIKKCRHCDGDVKDYGGHRGALNPKGLNLTDVWGDIPPVRHWKFKSKKRRANALSTKLLERVVEMSTDPGTRFWIPLEEAEPPLLFAKKQGVAGSVSRSNPPTPSLSG